MNKPVNPARAAKGAKLVRPDYALSDRYAVDQVFLTGTQALVRLPLEQAKRDRAEGLQTAGYITGYRGSPLAVYDHGLVAAEAELKNAGIRFVPAINEDLAATALIGTQELASDPDRNVEGVFGIWYGKGPGVDRAGDALKHGNALGASAKGGVVALLGDDHGCVSSSMPHQSDQALVHMMMPVVHPATVADYLDFGLFAFAASRFSGAWVGLKTISEVLESGASVDFGNLRTFSAPKNFAAPDLPLNHDPATSFGPVLEQKMLIRLEAFRAFAAANSLDSAAFGASQPKKAIIAVGKAFADTLDALKKLGIDDKTAKAQGIGVYKVGVVWPIIPEGFKTFLKKADNALVIEEKRAFVESQLKELFFNDKSAPNIIGKRDIEGKDLMPETGELRPSILLPVLAKVLKVALPEHPSKSPVVMPFAAAKRTPYFCSGCPHNNSTKVPEGSEARPGIGCHFMASWMDRATTGIVQMGGEGINWAGWAPFTSKKHMFQNLGDGTYFHSGLMAIRQSIALKTNVTYKVLYNDAVAMTGGQPIDGTLSVEMIVAQLRAEGIYRIAILSEDPKRFGADLPRGPGITLGDRTELDTIQRELRDIPGVTALVYDQGCATEKRRKRKRGELPEPAERVFINKEVCEGCGDCSVQSNCVSIVPVKTEDGVKRAIDQSTCNKDFSCVRGFCPSFVTVSGKALQKEGDAAARAELMSKAKGLAEPTLGTEAEILITGIGGTGIVTIGAVLAMAAHLEGRGSSVLDFMGFAQKGGAVISHLKLFAHAHDVVPVRIDKNCATAVIGCDLVVASMPEPLATLDENKTRVIANAKVYPTGDFVLRGLSDFQEQQRLELIARNAKNADAFDATDIALRLFGDSVFANMILMGAAWQKGVLPLDRISVRRAIELNGKAVPLNLEAFELGRLLATDPSLFAVPDDGIKELTAPEQIAAGVAKLTAYHNAKYAGEFSNFMARVESIAQPTGVDAFVKTVAKNLARIMAIKDEYQVARLHLAGALDEMRSGVEGGGEVTFHFAPPLLSFIKTHDGRPKKLAIPGWLGLPLLQMLAALRPIRNTWFDPFGLTRDRREERGLIAEYRALVESLLPRLTKENAEELTKIASLVDMVRGYGPVRRGKLEAYRKKLVVERAALETEVTKKAA